MSPGKPYLAEMPPAKVEAWTLELSAYGFGGTASGMLRSTSLGRSHYQIPGAMGCYRQELRCIAGGSGMRNCSGRESQPPVADPEEVDAEIRFLLAALERV